MAHKLIELIESGVLLEEKTFQGISETRILNNRDKEAFERDWLRVYNDLALLKSNTNMEENVSVQKHAFMKVNQFIPLSELCGYISDDFELFYIALATGYNDPWLSALGNEYLQHRIPTGKLTPLNKDLKYLFGV